MKKLLSSLIIVALLLAPLPAFAANVVVKDQPLQLDQPAFIEEGRTYVPMRAIFEALGATVDYDQATGVVTGKRGDKTVRLEKPYIVNGRTMVPLRYISETLGSKVDWIQSNQTAYVDSTLPSNTFQQATIARHIDGDTVEVTINGATEKIRMIGVDTPETKHPKKGVEYFGKEASAFTAEKLAIGAAVWLQKDVSDRDKYGRLLRYVWTMQPATDEPSVDEIKAGMHNAVLVANGYAAPLTYPPDVKYAELFNSLSQGARNGGWGLWGAPTVQPAPSNPAPSTQGVIKGNRRSMIYHRPGQQSYNKISARNVVYFNTAAEAEAAGYRAAKR